MDQSNYHFQKFLQAIKDEMAAAVANSVIDALKHAQNSSNEGTEDEFLTVPDVIARFKISNIQFTIWKRGTRIFLLSG